MHFIKAIDVNHVLNSRTAKCQDFLYLNGSRNENIYVLKVQTQCMLHQESSNYIIFLHVSL